MACSISWSARTYEADGNDSVCCIFGRRNDWSRACERRFLVLVYYHISVGNILNHKSPTYVKVIVAVATNNKAVPELIFWDGLYNLINALLD